MALASFQRSLEKSTENPQAYFEMGTILYEKNKLLPAKNALLSAVREGANNPEYLSKLASVYLAMGDADAAIESLKRSFNRQLRPSATAKRVTWRLSGRSPRPKGNWTTGIPRQLGPSLRRRCRLIPIAGSRTPTWPR